MLVTFNKICGSRPKTKDILHGILNAFMHFLEHNSKPFIGSKKYLEQKAENDTHFWVQYTSNHSQ